MEELKLAIVFGNWSCVGSRVRRENHSWLHSLNRSSRISKTRYSVILLIMNSSNAFIPNLAKRRPLLNRPLNKMRPYSDADNGPLTRRISIEYRFRSVFLCIRLPIMSTTSEPLERLRTGCKKKIRNFASLLWFSASNEQYWNKWILDGVGSILSTTAYRFLDLKLVSADLNRLLVEVHGFSESTTLRVEWYGLYKSINTLNSW
jgi:hypothetical protein